MKSILFLVFALLSCNYISAQDYFITNLYEYELFLMNPAAAGGSKSCSQVNVFNQKQWFDMEGSPTTQIISFQTGLTSQFGIGTYIYNDQNGYTSEIGLQQSFSYEIKLQDQLKRKSYLSFGLSINAEQVKIDESTFYEDGSYDPIVSGGVESGWGLNANTGVLFKYNNYHIGVALTNLLGQTNTIYDDSSEESEATDFHIHAGTWFKLASRDLILYPELMYRFNSLSDSRFDINMKFKMPTYNDNVTLWSLLCYRRNMVSGYGKDLSASFTMGVNVSKLSFGIEYNQSLSGSSSYYGNAYQAILGYRFNCRENKNGRVPCSFQDVIYKGIAPSGIKKKR
jgi:type IX secretion system PorP/SprF family membrane protein